VLLLLAATPQAALTDIIGPAAEKVRSVMRLFAAQEK
jgi:hypothetical protein